MDSQPVAAGVVHESPVGAMELFAEQLTGFACPTPIHNTYSLSTDRGCHMDGFDGGFQPVAKQLL